MACSWNGNGNDATIKFIYSFLLYNVGYVIHLLCNLKVVERCTKQNKRLNYSAFMSPDFFPMPMWISGVVIMESWETWESGHLPPPHHKAQRRSMSVYLIQGGPKKPHKVNDTIILQPYVIESRGFQQNVPKEISYVTKVNIW